MTACGDPITANHDWHGVATPSTYLTSLQMPSGLPVQVLHNVLSGHLIDARGHQVPGTSFVEDCTSFAVRPGTTNVTMRECTLVLDTGSRFYAARGATTGNSNYGQLGSLGPGGLFGPGGGVINVQLVKAQPMAKYLVLFSAQKNTAR
jgi:hypothetical protein